MTVSQYLTFHYKSLSINLVLLTKCLKMKSLIQGRSLPGLHGDYSDVCQRGTQIELGLEWYGMNIILNDIPT